MAREPLERATCPNCQSTLALVAYRLQSGGVANYCPNCDHASDVAPLGRADPQPRPHPDDSALILQMQEMIESFDRMAEAAVKLAAHTEQMDRSAPLKLVQTRKTPR
jgi:ssDNA-binding Zn-finger/Zn-ribbon topoisomerase 1